ncbi:MAG: thymidylate synthase [Methanocalculaceae archaeon]|jgi:thymidylate synthase|nr:thymidylate synthase [Methanocalculaceae archaeon]
MKIIRAPNLGRAHELAVRHILQEGQFLQTENGEDTVETEEICLRIETPLASPMTSACSRLKEAFLESYTRSFLDGSDSIFAYDYHQRLFDWGCGLHADACSQQPSGLQPAGAKHQTLFNAVHCDQIQYILEKLRNCPMSRRAIGVTWCPPVDESAADVPCLQLIQCVVRGGSLSMKAVFRSNDILSAAGANMFALAHLQEHIASSVGVLPGSYTHIALVPHIYFKRDAADIPPFCQQGAVFTPNRTVCRTCGLPGCHYSGCDSGGTAGARGNLR